MGNLPARRPTAYLRGNDLARFDSYLDKRDDGCWIFDSQEGTEGYRQFYAKGKRHGAHRWAYEQWVGPIPKGLVVDHRCRVRSCVNPEHLEAVTHAENRRRRENGLCVRGHSLTDPANVYLHDGKRHCRACRRQKMAEYRGYEGRQPNWISDTCKRGHDIRDPANVYVYRGERTCRECRRIARRRYEQRKREAA